MTGFDVNAISTPYYIVDESLIKKNLETLKSIKEASGCKILLAQKAFSMFALYPLIAEYLDGSTASGLNEARLGYEFMGGETHVFSPAYTENEFDDILSFCGHIVFNSVNQWNKFKEKALSAQKNCGIRINPEFSTQSRGIYDPCAYGSRLGVTAENLKGVSTEGISGLHFHTLCEQNSDDLRKTIDEVERKFGEILHKMDWVNFGGGHLITGENYNIPLLTECITKIRRKYGIEVYIEPGEAVALNAGFLVATVIDIVHNGIKTAVLDTSAACHMPDVLEAPYRPHVIGSGLPDEFPYTYRLAGSTCLAGDIIGDYSFKSPLEEGSKLILCDMAHYSMVKNNTFNGINLPSIAVKRLSGKTEILRSFGYEDFKARLS